MEILKICFVVLILPLAICVIFQTLRISNNISIENVEDVEDVEDEKDLKSEKTSKESNKI